MKFRFFLIALFVYKLVGCELKSNEVHPLFYQMSSSDSTRCMNAILEGIHKEAENFQALRVKYLNEELELCCECNSERLVFSADKSGKITNSHKIKSKAISDVVLEFFMQNRYERNYEYEESKEMSWSYYFPRYDLYTLSGIEKKRKQFEEDFDQLQYDLDTDSLLRRYFEQERKKYTGWMSLLKVLKTDTLFLQREVLFITVDLPRSEKKSSQIVDEVLEGYYKLRNFECALYFGESYLSLYNRTKNRKRKIDLDKLEALEMLRPVLVFNVFSAKRCAVSCASID